MVLPFFTALASIGFAMKGDRAWCLRIWQATLLIFAWWCLHHMDSALPVSL
ncbi:MAG: DUF5993 family protein [Candidimonas sp.]